MQIQKQPGGDMRGQGHIRAKLKSSAFLLQGNFEILRLLKKTTHIYRKVGGLHVEHASTNCIFQVEHSFINCIYLASCQPQHHMHILSAMQHALQYVLYGSP